MADFGRRAFRLDRPDARDVLELHARSFLDGFNLALARWPRVHDVLSGVTAEERGFAYEGAAMYAGLRGSRALARLLDGPGDGYVHLIHVGTGWGMIPARLPRLVRMPGTPLLRWLALDGEGFARVFFGGLDVLSRRCRLPLTAEHLVKITGYGRALWFAEAADPGAIAAVIGRQPEGARPELWRGVGLAAAYAGATDADGLAGLAGMAEGHANAFAQGVVFGVTARVRSGIVPGHTELACRLVLDADCDEAAAWADDAAAGLDSTDVLAYQTWRARLRSRVMHRP
jgi:hypothetical protein